MPTHAPQAFLIFSGFNLRAIVAFCRALEQDRRSFRIVACTTSDPIFLTTWKNAVVATRELQALEMSDIERCIALASATAKINAWCIAPSSEFFIRWCMEYRSKLAELGCSLPLPDQAIYLKVSDKRPFTNFCRARGLGVPAEGATVDAVGLPCVAKPMANITRQGISLYPWLLQTEKDLADFRATAPQEEYFFQEWVQGESIYLLLHLSKQGHAVRFSQRNLAQQPRGKSIVLAEPADFHLSAAANDWENAIRETGFFGLVMIELRLRASGEAVLIEANPRLWGPLQLVVDYCPALIDAFFDEILGTRTVKKPLGKAGRDAGYLWLGGARQTWRSGHKLTWHLPLPSRPCWALLQRLWTDVYLRRDTLLWFWREL